MASIVSINTSKKKGVVKTPVAEADVYECGIAGDAHSGEWHRQVSLLSRECIDQFSRMHGQTFNNGDFAENLTTQGLDLSKVAILDGLEIGRVELEVTQIGKECHGGACAIFKAVGKCVMPKEGIFTRVVQGGHIRTGDTIVHRPRPLRIHVVTLSDRASKGQYEDRSGPAIQQAVEEFFVGTRWHLEVVRLVLPDDAAALKHALSTFIASDIDVVFTTGGTGIGPRDITPETVVPLLDREIPGIMEYIRVKHGERLPSALLSRSVAGIASQTLVYTLPGSVKAVEDYLAVILPTLQHSIFMVHGIDAH